MSRQAPPRLSTETALEERVKELTCLLKVAQIAAKPGISLDEILHQAIGLLIPAWQYPDITSARIVLDGQTYAAANFHQPVHSQRAEVFVNGAPRGHVEVVYLEKRPRGDEGPFLREERNLIDAVAHQVGLIVHRKDAEQQRTLLENQLRHADRLATIGLLGAGVAHELNEPLGNILGFAQLAKKCPNLPESAHRDIEKIEAASLHAREVIKKLLTFARQVPSEQRTTDVNQVVRDSLYFFEARCAKTGIAVEYELDPGLPAICADPAQINQVLVNLVVNALQAMPDGGVLRVKTAGCDGCICLSVEDSGIGMTPDVLEQVFVPFFTTKDVGQGTGLGLPVVHGIVTSHAGAISIHSEPGRGTRVDVRLPTLPNDQEPERAG